MKELGNVLEIWFGGTIVMEGVIEEKYGIIGDGWMRRNIMRLPECVS